jgi:preprotein translocase subunit SecE
MKQIQTYVRESFAELSKVTWPSKEELKGSTTVVIAFSVVASVFIWAVDLGLTKLFEEVLS